MSYLSWHVGMKGVCINNANNPGFDWAPGEEPDLNRVYTIRSIHIDEYGETIVRLNELDRTEQAKREWGPLVGYCAHRFRPVQTRKTDIGVFTAMLHDLHQKVDA